MATQLPSKYLVYFTIGGTPNYVSLLEFCLHTLRSFEDNRNLIDTMVMCDESFVPHVEHLPFDYFHITQPNQNAVYASMRKVEIFNFEKISDYEKVIYLDCDIVVGGSLKSIFDLVVSPELLYVRMENTNPHGLKNSYYQCKDDQYTNNDMEMFVANNIYPFNAGQFGFIVGPIMRDHFTVITQQIHTRYNSHLHFYEQSFMNTHFNRNKAVSYDIADHVNIFAGILKDLPNKVINHFSGSGTLYTDKLKAMKDWHSKYLYDTPIKTKDTRNELHTILASTHERIQNIAEIGAFKGDYADYIFTNVHPLGIFYIIDPWQGNVCSGDANGNNMQAYHGEDLFQHVTQRFKNTESVKIIRKFSGDLTQDDISHKSLDAIYIDGDHSYQGVLNDLHLAWRLVKYGGWICGHDYEMNHEKTNANYDFGVKAAVHDFCKEVGVRVWYLMRDGCVSFAIRI